MKKIILSFILGILSGIVIFTLGVLIPIFISTLPLGFNLQKLPKAYTVLSGSMEPVIKVGCVVISKPSSFYSKGDIITFSLNGNKKNLITHRIEAKLFPDGVDKEPVYLTSGDANEDFDTGFVKNENIIGKVVFTVPYLGYFANFAKTPKGLLLLVIIPATIVIYEELKSLGSQFLRGVKKLRKKEKRNQINLLRRDREGLPKITIVIPVFGAFLVLVALSSSYLSDLEKSIGSMFQAASSFPETLILENKRVSIPPNDWSIIEDGKKGTLTFEPVYPTFKFNFEGSGLDPREEYCLIYYADGWPGSHPGYFLKSGSPDPSGNLSLSDNVDIGINLPDPADANYPSGAKIWLVDCSSYNKTTLSLTGWNPNSPDWLFETRLIKYTRVVPSPTPTAIPAPSPTPGGGSPSPTTIYLDHLGGDIGDQYGYWLDYTNASSNNVYFSYLSPVPSKLSGTIYGTSLKPYATYQVKFGGIPACIDSINGNDLANEYIGYKGRWTCVSSNCSTQSASERNRSDAQYVINKAKLDSDPTKECIAGYLVWDQITADSTGVLNKAVSTSNSFHVLGCEGTACGGTGNTYLINPDLFHPSVKFCPADKVDGQIEKGSCGGLTLDIGNYHLQMSLTEESFHLGNWATVLYGNIDFEIQ